MSPSIFLEMECQSLVCTIVGPSLWERRRRTILKIFLKYKKQSFHVLLTQKLWKNGRISAPKIWMLTSLHCKEWNIFRFIYKKWKSFRMIPQHANLFPGLFPKMVREEKRDTIGEGKQHQVDGRKGSDHRNGHKPWILSEILSSLTFVKRAEIFSVEKHHDIACSLVSTYKGHMECTYSYGNHHNWRKHSWADTQAITGVYFEKLLRSLADKYISITYIIQSFL